MNELQIFNSEEFGEVRTVEIDGKPYFVANDVARALGYKRPADAITQHCKGSVKRRYLTEGGNQEMKMIPEGDMYRLITHSKLESAQRFETWVFDDVIPSIRKNGSYNMKQPQGKELLALAVLEAQKTIEEQTAQIEEMKPNALLGQAITTANTSILVGDLAKILRQNGVNIGGQRLFAWMRENGYLIKRKGTDWNLPTQKSMEMGLFEIKESVHIDGNGCNKISRTPKITGKGQKYFINKFLEVA